MSETARRTFEGLVNFRDLGGLPVAGGGEVRSGVLFRSDSLCYATQADADHLVDKLSLATIIDLRDESEVAEFGRGPLETMSVGYLSVPVGDVPEYDTRPEFYVGVLAQNGERLGSLIRTLADPATLPAVVHCHVGCDRTGIVSAAVLSLVGVSDEDVPPPITRAAAEPTTRSATVPASAAVRSGCHRWTTPTTSAGTRVPR